MSQPWLQGFTFFTDALQDADSRAELERKNHVMVVHPRQASLPLNSVIVTLYYCCRYHFGEPEVLCTMSSLLQLLKECFLFLLIVQSILGRGVLQTMTRNSKHMQPMAGAGKSRESSLHCC